MAQDMSQLTDMMMVNPWMFDPTQKSNQFSNFNNAALPWPPTYNPGLQGGPVNAATGQPIQSFQQWQQQNPGGMSINATPAQPAPQPPNQGQGAFNNAMLNSMGLAASNQMAAQQQSGARGGAQTPWSGPSMSDIINMRGMNNAMSPGQGGSPGSAGGQGAAPNNWQAAINSLANPGNPMTMGANVPMVTGGQPAGGVNQAFLNQAQGQPGMNPRFMSALAAIQGRPGQ